MTSHLRRSARVGEGIPDFRVRNFAQTSSSLNVPCSLLFSQITDLQHSVTSPTSFRLEYKRSSHNSASQSSSSNSSSTSAMFQRQRQVRMQVDINHVSTAESGPEALYAITFTLLSGETA